MRQESEALENTNLKLKSEVGDLKSRLTAAERRALEVAEAKKSEEDMLRLMEKSLDDAKNENEKRIMDTTQFQTMKKMMQKQSAQIRDLRRRLQQYEPDNTKTDDD